MEESFLGAAAAMAARPRTRRTLMLSALANTKYMIIKNIYFNNYKSSPNWRAGLGWWRVLASFIIFVILSLDVAT